MSASSSSREPTSVLAYDPFEGVYDGVRTVDKVFENMYDPQYFAQLLEELRLKDRISDYHAQGFRNDQTLEVALPEEVRRLILVTDVILGLVLWGRVEKQTDLFLSLQPPVLRAEKLKEIDRYMHVDNGDSLLRAFIRYYPEEWTPLVTNRVNNSIGMQGDAELFDILVANDVQPSFEMLEGAVYTGELDIIDRLFCVSTEKVRALRADEDGVGRRSPFVDVINAIDEEARFYYRSDVTHRLAMYGFNPNGNGTRPLPLEAALTSFNVAAIEDLLVLGANPNIIVESNNSSALFFAVIEERLPISVLKLLVQYGADVNLVYNGMTALSMATGEKREYLLPLTDANLHNIVVPRSPFMGSG